MAESKKERKGSPLLDRMIQRNMADRMKYVDEKVLAQAIKTLLMRDDNKYMN